MKKKMMNLLIVFVLSVLACSCGQEQSEIESPNQTTEADIEITEADTEIIEAATLCFENIIEDAAVVDKIEELIICENQFIIKLDTEWPDDNAEEVEYNEVLYLLVGELSWSEYESMARNYYSDDYIASNFTPWYLEDTQTFLELDGKLYRAESDGIGITVKEDSIDLWEIAEGLYYVTVLLDTDDQTTVRVYIVQEDLDKEYGFIILNKYML